MLMFQLHVVAADDDATPAHMLWMMILMMRKTFYDL
jgi:hypothetical protein